MTVKIMSGSKHIFDSKFEVILTTTKLLKGVIASLRIHGALIAEKTLVM